MSRKRKQKESRGTGEEENGGLDDQEAAGPGATGKLTGANGDARQVP